MSESDRMNAYLLGHIRALETMLMLVLNAHPAREQIKRDAEYWQGALATLDLNQPISEEEIEARQKGIAAALAAMFVELPKAPQSGPAHNA
jgi:hypothetical protein